MFSIIYVRARARVCARSRRCGVDRRDFLCHPGGSRFASAPANVCSAFRDGPGLPPAAVKPVGPALARSKHAVRVAATAVSLEYNSTFLYIIPRATTTTVVVYTRFASDVCARTLSLRTLSVRICNTTSDSARFRSATLGRSSRASVSRTSSRQPRLRQQHQRQQQQQQTPEIPNPQILLEANTVVTNFFFFFVNFIVLRNNIFICLLHDHRLWMWKLLSLKHFAFVAFIVFAESR